jgi:hypothetical protein
MRITNTQYYSIAELLNFIWNLEFGDWSLFGYWYLVINTNAFIVFTFLSFPLAPFRKSFLTGLVGNLSLRFRTSRKDCGQAAMTA